MEAELYETNAEERDHLHKLEGLINNMRKLNIPPDTVMALISNVLGRFIVFLEADPSVAIMLILKNIEQGYKEEQRNRRREDDD